MIRYKPIRYQALSPDGLGLSNKTIHKSSFISRIKEALNHAEISPDIRTFLVALLEASKGNGIIKDEDVKDIADADLNTIAKDFGELSGALWFMSHYNTRVQSITYPAVSNSKLVDYIANIDPNNKISISAKAQTNKSSSGAPPSISNIADQLDTMKFTNPDKEAARKAVIMLRDESAVDGIVNASKLLGTPGYKWVKQNLFNGRDWRADQIEEKLENYRTAKGMLADLKDLYTLIGRSGSEDTAEQIIRNKDRRWGMVISPLGAALADELNKNKTYVEVLNAAAQRIKAVQIYIKIKKPIKKVEYKVSDFDSSDFTFSYNGNAREVTKKKLSFIMKR